MKNYKTIYLLIAVLMLLPCAAYPQSYDRNAKISLDIQEAPIASALHMLFKMNPVNYTVDPSLLSSNLKISAVLKDVPFEDALKTILKSSGATFTFKDNAYAIVSAAPVTPMTTAPKVTSDCSQYKITLKYLYPGEVIPILNICPGIVQINSIGERIIVITANASAIQEAVKVVSMLDTPDAASQVVHVTLNVVVRVSEAGKKPREYVLTSESVGREGVSMPINMSIQPTGLGGIITSGDTCYGGIPSPGGSSYGGSSLGGAEASRDRDNISLNLNVKLTPQVRDAQKKYVNLDGSGYLTGYVPQTFMKNFNFALPVPITQGKDGNSILTSGSFKDEAADIDFRVLASVRLGDS